MRCCRLPPVDRARRVAAVVVLFFGCSEPSEESQASVAPSATTATSVSSPKSTVPAIPKSVRERLAALRAIEEIANAHLVREADRSHRDPRVRRAATRALARIGTEDALEGLRHALADEDGDVVAWAAYGLGRMCRQHPDEIVRALAVRSASVSLEGLTAEGLDLPLSFAMALGRCEARAAEATLRGWLSGAPAFRAVAPLGLGGLALSSRALSDSTLVALLDATDRAQVPPSTLFGFELIVDLSESVQKRLVSVAKRAAGSATPHIVRALERGGGEMVPALKEILDAPEQSVAARAAAARSLGQLSAPGQLALRGTLSEWSDVPSHHSEQLLEPAFWVPLSTALGALQPPAAQIRETLETWSDLELTESKALRLRQVKLRCAAAQILANRASLSKRLQACDPDEGRVGKLAAVKVLSRGQLHGARLTVWKRYAKDEDALVVQAALQLLSFHPEVENAAAALAVALGSSQGGTVARAAQLIAKRPGLANRAGVFPPAQDPQLWAALSAAFDKARPADQVAVQVRLIDAVAALQILSRKPRIEELCRDPNASLRNAAARALIAMGRTDPKPCPAPAPPTVFPKAALQPTRLVNIVFQSDVGPLSLSLDRELAPRSVARIVELVEGGFYQGLAVHRVETGRALQLGDRAGDGFGSADKSPLPLEGSPKRFSEFHVGMVSHGPSTSSAAIFVTLSARPDLIGDYTWLGTASAEWAKLEEGDEIQTAELTEP